MPIEPPATDWILPAPDTADPSGLVGVGADLEPGTLLAAYRQGLFPMPLDLTEHVDADELDALARQLDLDLDQMIWWSPDPRCIIPLDGLRITRSMRQSATRFGITFDHSFDEVTERCADPDRDGGWIDDRIRRAYRRLHDLGWAHSVEVRDPVHGDLAGGLYGVLIGGFFAGESMFHRRRDASKVALMALVAELRAIGATLLDAQWMTPHLRSLGAVEIPRSDYLSRLAKAITMPTGTFGEARS